MRILRAVGWKGALLGVMLVLFVGGGTGAAVCKFTNVDCSLRESPSVLDFQGEGAGTMDLPPGFSVSAAAQELNFPTDFDFLPDEQILIAEKNGLVRVLREGELQEQPFLDLSANVNRWQYRGLVNVTVDPDFETNPFVYVVYTARGVAVDSPEPTSVRVSRFRVDGDEAIASSEQVLLGSVGGRSCTALRPGSDCVPADVNHVGADIVFASDGTMFVSTGDGGGTLDGTDEAKAVDEAAFLAQDLDSLGGKVLRVDREGRGLPDNPYWNGDPDANRSKVWAHGLRNPFRAEALPTSSPTLVVADVGLLTYEELNRVERGDDLGWPCFEGPNRTPQYRSHAFCRSYYEREEARTPWVAIRRAKVVSITGGVPLTAAEGWPAEYANSYVFGDWLTSELYTVPLSERSPTPLRFAGHAAGPVAFALGPDGSLYYLAINVGELRRITPG